MGGGKHFIRKNYVKEGNLGAYAPKQAGHRKIYEYSNSKRKSTLLKAQDRHVSELPADVILNHTFFFQISVLGS